MITYAASLGRESLDAQYDQRFSELLAHVDAVSVREEAAIPYIKRFYKGKVQSVLDPIFLLEKKEWVKVENMFEIGGYILVYATEFNKSLVDYAKKLSIDKGLPVTELRTSAGGTDSGFHTDYTAGPAEFLGYIHRADYVVTNSFHAAAFSIIYQKKFIVFPHSRSNARLSNILDIHGLGGRLWQEGKEVEIDSLTDWEKVERKTAESVQLSVKYLMKELS